MRIIAISLVSLFMIACGQEEGKIDTAMQISSKMMNKSLPHPGINPITKEPWDDDYAKTLALIEVINRKAEYDDDLALNLEPDEACIYFANRLSSQINMSGVDNFFDDGIGPYYDVIITALKRLEADEMILELENVRKFVMLDHEITEESIFKYAYEHFPKFEGDNPPWEPELQSLCNKEVEDGFHSIYNTFLLSYFDAQGYELESYEKEKQNKQIEET